MGLQAPWSIRTQWQSSGKKKNPFYSHLQLNNVTKDVIVPPLKGEVTTVLLGGIVTLQFGNLCLMPFPTIYLESPSHLHILLLISAHLFLLCALPLLFRISLSSFPLLQTIFTHIYHGVLLLQD